MAWTEPVSGTRGVPQQRRGADEAVAFAVHSDWARRRLTLVGELDIAAVADLVDSVTAFEARGAGRVELDLSYLTFIDGAGVNALLDAVHAAQVAGGSLELVGIPPKVARVLSITGFTTSPAA